MVEGIMRKTRDRDALKNRIQEWMSNSSIFKNGEVLDMAILETFYYVYNGLEEGFNIHELGNELGVFPTP